MEQRPNGSGRRFAWKLLGGASAALAVALVALWLLWGFRWPPTAEVVTEETGGIDAEHAPGPSENR